MDKNNGQLKKINDQIYAHLSKLVKGLKETIEDKSIVDDDRHSIACCLNFLSHIFTYADNIKICFVGVNSGGIIFSFNAGLCASI
jgi:hypothetical protein